MLRLIRTVPVLLLVYLLSSVGIVNGQQKAYRSDELLGSTLCAEVKQATLEQRRSMHPAKTTSFASENFDAGYYHLVLDLRLDQEYLYGQTRITGRVVGTSMVSLSLDFSSNMIVDSVWAENGNPLLFSHEDDVVTVPLPAPAMVGSEVTVYIAYRGKPMQEGWGTFVFGHLSNDDPYVWSLSEPYGAREWWPSKDHPSDKADSVRVSLTVPRDMLAGSNGLLETTIENTDGTTTYDWFSRYPIASYLVSLAVGRYDQFVQTYSRPDSLATIWGDLDLPILHYAYQETNVYDGTDEYYGWSRVVDVLPVLEYWFGPYPFPEEKYGHAHVTFGGGMEHQTMTSMGNSSVGLITHELAHMWFGDKITMRYWPHLWLNEGFATYAELLYWQSQSELYPNTYNQVFSTYYDRARTAPGTLIVEDTTSVSNLFRHSRVYSKGGMVLHMLRGMLGDETFREILRTYATDEAVQYGTAVTEDFQRVSESVSGQDLDIFFRQWVTEGTGHPVYEVGWGYRPVAWGYEVIVTVDQTQEEPASSVPVFTMPVTIAVQSNLGEQRFTVMNNQRNQTYVIETLHAPNNVIFDPDENILRNRYIEALRNNEMPAIPLTTEITARYPNPTKSDLYVNMMLAKTGPVRLSLYDELGRLQRTFFDGNMPGGSHTFWFSLEDLASGTYFLSLSDMQRTHTQPLIYINDE